MQIQSLFTQEILQEIFKTLSKDHPSLESINILTITGIPLVSSSMSRAELSIFSAMASALIQTSLMGFEKLNKDERPKNIFVLGTQGQNFYINALQIGDYSVIVLLISKGNPFELPEIAGKLAGTLFEKIS
ncbi:MAG: hypothetical protein ACXAC7_05720 [Candidatus Hodarchaeales archaeon]